MNFDYKGNGGKKSFSSKSKDQCRVFLYGEHGFRAHNKNNRDHYEYPSLTHFTDEL